MKFSEEPVSFILNTGGKIESAGVAATTTITENKGPQTIDLKLVSALVGDCSQLGTVVGIIGVDPAVTKIADQQSITEESKTGWRDDQAPRRVKHSI